MSACNCCEKPDGYWRIESRTRTSGFHSYGLFTPYQISGVCYTQYAGLPGVYSGVVPCDMGFLVNEERVYDTVVCTRTVTLGTSGNGVTITPSNTPCPPGNRWTLSGPVDDDGRQSYVLAAAAAATWSDWPEAPWVFDRATWPVSGNPWPPLPATAQQFLKVDEAEYRVAVCHLPTGYLKIWWKVSEYYFKSGVGFTYVDPSSITIEPTVIQDATLRHGTYAFPDITCNALSYFGEFSLEMPSRPTDRAEVHGVSPVLEKFSYLPDYEPDISDPENPQPNGFPDPTWEPAAP